MCYCDDNCFDVVVCFALFVQVCVGVQYVYLCGVIYCDLKFLNILVVMIDGVVLFKIIDFGIVKVIGLVGDVSDVYMRIGYLFGMFEYMSFEQVQLVLFDIDVCMDVYLFGVVFYELCGCAVCVFVWCYLL